MSGNTQGGQSAAQTPAAPVTRDSLERDSPAVYAEVVAIGATAERDRVAGVRAQSVPGHEALIEKMAGDGKSTGADAAMAIVAATRTQLAAAAAAHAADAPPAAPSAAAADDGGAKTKGQQAAEAKAYAAKNGCTFVSAMKTLGFAS